MPKSINFSIIVPVYNRPEEMKELLESLSCQTDKVFEVVVVEDGSSITSEQLCQSYSDRINIQYFYKDNEGPSIGRNYGLARAKGNYFLFFDSDCIIPKHYIKTIREELNNDFVDAFGGPDGAMEGFSDFQKAVSYAMTSLFTSGGIRGGKTKVGKFHPRSFNLGFSQAVYESTGGFPVTRMHPGEDMVFAIEVIARGFSTRLIRSAYVFHKRRVSYGKFYSQVFGFGKTRYIISCHYPDTFKIFFVFPSLFLLGSILLLLLALFVNWLFILPLVFYAVVVFIDSLLRNRSVSVAVQSVASSLIQLWGYGLGFLDAIWKHRFLKKDEFGVFGKSFYQ